MCLHKYYVIFPLGGLGFPFSPFNSEGGQFNLDDVRCSENDTSIADCSHDGYNIHNCNNVVTKQAAVVCGTTAGAHVHNCDVRHEVEFTHNFVPR